MIKKGLHVIILLGLVTQFFTACKEKTDPAPKKDVQQRATDVAARTELDRVQNDIETVYNSNQYAGNAKVEAVVLPCGNVTLNTNNFTITYNGVNCGSRILGGSIDVELINGTKFSDVNAKLKITFNNYKVHYNASGEEIVYNGTMYTTNATGGKLVNLFTNAGNIVHRTRGTLTLTYDTTGLGGSTFSRTWNLFRKKTFSSNGSSTGVSLKFEGDTIIAEDTYLPGTYNAVCEYGTDVNDRKFIHTIPTPFVWNNCGADHSGPYILKTGRVEHTAYSDNLDYKFLFTATAGYREDGVNHVLDQTCASNGYLINWQASEVSSGNTFINYSVYQQY